MSLFKSIREIDQRFSWSFLGFMVAVLLGSVTLYIEFYKENKPDLNFIITANTSVLDIRENLGNLDVLYHGDSLSKNKKDLRLITFEVVNQGDAAILSNFYDKNDPVGFSVIDGKIADEPILIEASNDYLKNKLVIKKQSESLVLFSNVILEPQEYFKVKILVLHEISKRPAIKPFGKVAGVNNIDLFMDYTSGDKRSFLEETFGGGLYPNISRFILYGIGFIVFLISVFITLEKIGDYRERLRKNRLISIFKEYDSDKVSGKDSFFFDYYLTSGADILKQIQELLQDQERLNELSKEDPKAQKSVRHSFSFMDESNLFTELLGEAFVSIENGVLSVDAERLVVLTNFINFLKRKGEFKRSRDFYMQEKMVEIEIEEHNK